MAKRELETFVAEALRGGARVDEVRERLTGAGWSSGQVDAALRSFDGVAFGAPVPKPQSYTYAREAFLYIVLFLLLKIAAIHLGVLLFQIINLFLPDWDDGVYTVRDAIGAARWSTAATVVSFPLFLAVAWKISQDRRSQAMQSTAIRKWLVYVAMVGAAGVIVGDLAAVVFSYLNGDMTLRFILKTFVVLLIAGGILAFYLRDVSFDDEAVSDAARHRYAGWTLAGVFSAVALYSVVQGFVIAGSPGQVRAEERDKGRVQDLRALACVVDFRATLLERLPNINEVKPLSEQEGGLFKNTRCGVGGWAVSSNSDVFLAGGGVQDAYSYTPREGDRFEVCAEFERPTNRWLRPWYEREVEPLAPEDRDRFQIHDKGQTCFTTQVVRKYLLTLDEG